MAIDYRDSLGRLRSRRLGYDRDITNLTEALGKSERYEGRATTSATRYALGAMQAVDAGYTKVCFDEGDRVSKQLREGLAALGRKAEYEFQGSVPLDVHIRGASDVDLLVLHGRWLSYCSTGCLAHTYTTVQVSMVGEVAQLRKDCEDILDRRNWGAKVDKSGNKSIKLSEGGFKRKVDVVPGHWSDRAEYQASSQKHDREVYVLDKSVPELLSNLPFLHMKRINDKDNVTSGGAKMAIRLLKNLIADSDQKVELSSYDVAALVWTCPDTRIRFGWLRELSVLVGIERYLTELAADLDRAALLRTPDNTRRIMNSAAKLISLTKLATELSSLVRAVEDELIPLEKRATYAPVRRGELIASMTIPG